MNELPVVLFGVGGVGQALVRQIVENRERHTRQYGLWIRFLALCDSRSAVVEPMEGLNDAQLLDILDIKARGGSLREHPLGGTQDDLSAILDIVGVPGTLVVDCTATE